MNCFRVLEIDSVDKEVNKVLEIDTVDTKLNKGMLLSY